jgi:hypothetical protein
MSTVALQGVFDQILATFDLTAANKRWLAAHLVEYADKEERIEPYTMAEIDTMLAESEADFAAGRYKTNDQIFHHI